jgi:hypothetical protein
VAASFPLEELSITVTGVTAPGSDALLETGSVAQESRRDGHRETVVRRTFGLRIGALAAQATGRAVLSASIRDDSNGYRVRIDGMLLTKTPRVIDAHAPRGVVVTHRLEIEVPPTAPAGALDVTIDWEATTES